MSRPKISIITVNLNNSIGLQKTIESILNQTYTNIELIIIDGGSTDGSVEVLKKYEKHFSYWVSEKDSGIYPAMNKGIKKASGEYCLFLNSGDWLIDKEVLLNAFNTNPTADFLYGNLLIEDTAFLYPDKLSPYFFVKGTLCHQVVFIKTKLFQTFGYYNEKLKLVSDWEFFCKVLINEKSSYKHLNFAISYYDNTGLSSNPKHEALIRLEKESVLNQSMPLFRDALLLEQLFSALHNFDKKKIVSLLFKINWTKTESKHRSKVAKELTGHLGLFCKNIPSKIFKKKLSNGY